MTSPSRDAARTDPSPPGLDLDRLSRWLTRYHPDLAPGPLRAELIAGGRSNLTYRVTSDEAAWVLRRPPLGHVLATAHDMAREYRVISALAGTPVPVPEALALCPDADVVGAPFYLMTLVPGTVYRSRRQTDPLGEHARADLAWQMVDTLAALHAVRPDEVGLADFGRPEGFLARQVRRWAGQLDRSRSRDLPGIEELRDRLAATVPTDNGRAAVVHGDYRLDNLLVDAQPGAAGQPDRSSMRVTAVLDWEMATLGDPLTDLGLLLTYWDVLGGTELARDNPVADGLGTAAGFPPGAALLDRYARATGRDLPHLGWYTALGCFKLAVICEGIHYRYTLGQTVGAGFDRIGALVPPLVEAGRAALGADRRGSRAHGQEA
ncbi:MAG TPA: phosphotransferase family protein [Micromonosporaceae bacterium]